MSRLPTAAALLVLLVSLAGCPGEESPRAAFIHGWLQEQAPELGGRERAEVVTSLIAAEQEAGADAFLLLAVIEEESRYDPTARSARGARGLMQLRPSTAEDVAARAGLAWSGADDLDDPARNVRIGVAYLIELKERFGDWTVALSAYHSGPTRIRRIERRGGTVPSKYSARVLRRHERIRKAFAGASR